MEGETTYNQLCVHERQRRHCEACNRRADSTARKLEREQHRYEIARDVMAAMISKNPDRCPWIEFAKDSIAAADVLLAELEREDAN